MRLDQPTGEGETQAGTLLPGIGLSDLREFVEDQFLIFRCDTGTSVGDGQPDGGAVDDCLDRDRSAIRGELDRVRQEVVQDLSHAATIGNEAIDGAMTRDRKPLALGQWPESGDRLGHQGAKIECRAIQLEPAGLDLGQIQDLVDQREQVLAPGMDMLDPLDGHEPGIAVERLAPHELGEPQDGRERRPQLMTHVRDEVALCLARGDEALRQAGLFGVQLLSLCQCHRLCAEQIDQRSIFESEERSVTSKEHNRGSVGGQRDNRSHPGIDLPAEVPGDLTRGLDRPLGRGAGVG